MTAAYSDHDLSYMCMEDGGNIGLGFGLGLGLAAAAVTKHTGTGSTVTGGAVLSRGNNNTGSPRHGGGTQFGVGVPSLDETEPLDSFRTLVKHIDHAFAMSPDSCPHSKLLDILTRADLSSSEINKYTFWDYEKPYTRNLVFGDGKRYTLLLLCWTPGKESKIHNHPCDNCYLKCIRGCIRESCYAVLPLTDEIRATKTRFVCEGQVAFLNDDLGLHKVTNPSRDTGAVSLHLYTPPFRECKVWSRDGVGTLSQDEVGRVGFFSVMGHRTPHLEGVPGVHAQLVSELHRQVTLASGAHIDGTLKPTSVKAVMERKVFEAQHR